MRYPFNGKYALTQTFGNKLILNGVDVYKGFGLNGHNGLDFGLPTGTEVTAPHSGMVIEAFNDAAGYGWYLKIENDKEGSVLAHLKDFTVKIGDTVAEGQLIAHSDNSGNSTGAHLHWGYYTKPRNRQNGYAGFIDQLPIMQSIPVAPVPTPTPAPVETKQLVLTPDEQNTLNLVKSSFAIVKTNDGNSFGNMEGLIRSLLDTYNTHQQMFKLDANGKPPVLLSYEQFAELAANQQTINTVAPIFQDPEKTNLFKKFLDMLGNLKPKK